MTGYRDMTFCTCWEACKEGEKCHRAITKDVVAGAIKWWGGPGYPIAVFSEQPMCFEEKDESIQTTVS